MTREQTIEAIKVMQGYVDGKELEILSPFGKWERATAPRWQWDDTEYRIKLLEAGDAALTYSIGLDLQKENDALNQRIKRLEETLDKTTKIASQRIKRLEDRIHRASMAFFRDGSDGQVASGMLVILEEERGKP